MRALLSLALLASLAACTQLAQLEEYLRPKPVTTVSPNFRPQDHTRIAVVVLDHTGHSDAGRRRQVEDAFMQAVLRQGYRLAARSDVGNVIDEQRFERDGYTAEDIARAGQMLNVSALLIASIDNVAVTQHSYRTKEGTRSYARAGSSVSARLVSVREAEVLWLATYTGSRTEDAGHRDAGTTLGAVASVVATAFPPRYPMAVVHH